MAQVDRDKTCTLGVQHGAGVRYETVTGEATIGTSGAIRIGGSALPVHARIAHELGAWTLHAVGDGIVTINGARVRRPWTLESCDQIRVADTAMRFFPKVTAPPIAAEANGFSRAKHYIQAALDLHGSDRSFVTALANLEEAVGRAERLSVIQRAVELMNKDNFEDALRELDRVLTVAPRHATALLHKAICCMNLAMVAPARDYANKAREASRDDPETRKRADELLAQIREIGPRIALNPAIKLMNQSNFWKAREKINEALQLFPGDPSLLFHLAICQAKSNDFHGARASLNQIVGPVADAELRNDIANLRRQLGQRY
jgi:Flp pilus assembly protein TadD